MEKEEKVEHVRGKYVVLVALIGLIGTLATIYKDIFFRAEAKSPPAEVPADTLKEENKVAPIRNAKPARRTERPKPTVPKNNNPVVEKNSDFKSEDVKLFEKVDKQLEANNSGNQ